MGKSAGGRTPPVPLSQAKISPAVREAIIACKTEEDMGNLLLSWGEDAIRGDPDAPGGLPRSLVRPMMYGAAHYHAFTSDPPLIADARTGKTPAEKEAIRLKNAEFEKVNGVKMATLRLGRRVYDAQPDLDSAIAFYYRNQEAFKRAPRNMEGPEFFLACVKAEKTYRNALAKRKSDGSVTTEDEALAAADDTFPKDVTARVERAITPAQLQQRKDAFIIGLLIALKLSRDDADHECADLIVGQMMYVFENPQELMDGFAQTKYLPREQLNWDALVANQSADWDDHVETATQSLRNSYVVATTYAATADEGEVEETEDEPTAPRTHGEGFATPEDARTDASDASFSPNQITLSQDGLTRRWAWRISDAEIARREAEATRAEADEPDEAEEPNGDHNQGVALRVNEGDPIQFPNEGLTGSNRTMNAALNAAVRAASRFYKGSRVFLIAEVITVEELQADNRTEFRWDVKRPESWRAGTVIDTQGQADQSTDDEDKSNA
jgi:hypothetical protein